MSTPFRQHMDVLSKSPATAHGLAGRSPAGAEEGGLSLGHLSLATQRKVARPPQVDETLLLYKQQGRATRSAPDSHCSSDPSRTTRS
jgi:hypothetical protein